MLALGACGGDNLAGSEGLGDGSVSGTGGGFNGGTGGTLGIPSGGASSAGTAGSATGGSGGTPPDPEREIESAFEAPVATDRFVWTANPESGNVAVIDATTHAVRLAKAGFRPTTVAGLPGTEDEDGAL